MSYLRRTGRNPTPGLLAAACVAFGALMAVPRPALDAQQAARVREEHAARLARQELAAAIDDYRLDHGRLPGTSTRVGGEPRPDAERLVRQLTHASNRAGRVAPRREPEYPLGPYLVHGVPANPANGLSTIRLAPLDAAPDGTTGWIVDPATGQVASNHREQP